MDIEWFGVASASVISLVAIGLAIRAYSEVYNLQNTLDIYVRWMSHKIDELESKE